MDEKLFLLCKVHVFNFSIGSSHINSDPLKRLNFMHDKKLFLPCKVALKNKIVPFKNIANVMKDGTDKRKVKTRSGRTATVFNCDNKRTKQNVLVVKNNVRNSNEQNVTANKRTNSSSDTNLTINNVRSRRSNDKNLSDEQNRSTRSNNKNLNDEQNINKNNTKTKTQESQSSEKCKQQIKNNSPKEVKTRIRTQNKIISKAVGITDKKTKKGQTRSNKVNESRKLVKKNLSKTNKSIDKNSDSLKKSNTKIPRASITKNKVQSGEVQNDLETLGLKRTRKIPNYRESDGSVHIPIYQTLKTQKTENCHNKDVYEFHEVKENRKVHDSLLDNPFNKEMDEILVALEKKEKKAQKPIKRAVRARKNRKRVISETEPDRTEEEVIDNNKLEIIETSQKPLESSASQIDNNNTAADWGELFDDSLTELEAPKQIETNKKLNNINILSNISIRSPQVDTTKRGELLKQPQDPCSRKSVEWINYSTNELQVSFKRPDANSTMIFNANSSPWRSNLIVKSSPRFLLTKKSNLPVYEQDMVIDSSIVEKTFQNDSITPIKKTKQSSILNFITSNRVYDDSNKEKESDRSLYDEHLLSPIKKQLSPSKPSKNHSILGERNILEVNTKNAKSPRKTGEMNFPGVTKRRVFGERNSQDDQQDLMGRSQIFECYSVVDKENFDPAEDSCFGFDTSTKKSKSPKKKLSSKPTRIHINEIKEVLLSDETHDATVEIVEDFGNNDEQSLQQQEEPASFVGLFEDFKDHKDPPRVTYERKRTKRRRYYSTQEDEPEEIIPKFKKKKKDEPTKKELKEADEWAAAFNALCEEVEAHTLEIE